MLVNHHSFKDLPQQEKIFTLGTSAVVNRVFFYDIDIVVKTSTYSKPLTRT
jgi:hypothetical protein